MKQVTRFRGKVSLKHCDSYDSAVVDQAIRSLLEPFGGISCLAAPGQTVLLKPNLLNPASPERALTTHPELVRRVALLCFEAGAARVLIGDSPAGSHDEHQLWEKTGMLWAARESGAELKSFSPPLAIRQCGDISLPVPQFLDLVDIIISLPKLKTHLLTTLTCALKNTYGLVVGESKAWFHAKYPSPESMSSFLLDVYCALTPGFSIVDGITAMHGDGPANGKPFSLSLLAAGADAVSLDAVCASAMGIPPARVPMIRLANKKNIGVGRLTEISLHGDSLSFWQGQKAKLPKGRLLHYLPESLFSLVSRAFRYEPRIYLGHCTQCGICANTCSKKAITRASSGELKIDRGECILCMCCVESCPKSAIRVHSPASALWEKLSRQFSRGTNREKR